MYNVHCTYFGEYAHMGWTAGGGRLEYCTVLAEMGGEGILPIFHLLNMFTNTICIGRKARGGGVDYKRRWCDIGRLFLKGRELLKGKKMCSILFGISGVEGNL
jgi:hypothetical protein